MSRAGAVIVALALCACAGVALAAVPDDPLVQLYDRVAADLKGGGALRVLVHVALCDNDSQGIVPVENRSICNGNAPEQNIYWGTDGGLPSVLRKQRYKQIEYTKPANGPVLVRGVWTKTFAPGRALRERGVTDPVRVEVVGLAYRGSEIRTAMLDYVQRAHDDAGDSAQPALAPHVVGYIGHNYFYDTRDRAPFVLAAQHHATAERGVFALSCNGDRYHIRSLVTSERARVLSLDTNLTYPGAWTVHGLVEGLARGDTLKGIHRQAATRYAEGFKVKLGVALRMFAYGP
jgi:hypothetical protein